jgi:O-antigen/teichoic acid export membrane protein
MSILVATLRPEWQLMSPIWVSTGFSLFFLLGFAVLWRWVVRKHKDSVTTLYSVVSGFRMLMALFTLFIVFLVVGRAAMLPYVLVFMIFYLVMVAYHSIYFSRITNRQ